MLGLGNSLQNYAIPAAAVAASGPGSYNRSIYMDGTNDTIRCYSGADGSSSYENTYDEMEDLRDVILDPHNTTWTWDLEFRPHTAGSSLIFESVWGEYNTSTNGGLKLQCYYWIATGLYINLYWYRKSEGGDGGYLRKTFWFQYGSIGGTWGETNHFTDATIKSFWHKLTICKGTGDSLDDANIKVYLNGVGPSNITTNNNGSWATADGPIPNDATWAPTDNNLQNQWFGFLSNSPDLAFGSMSFYDKMLSSTEVNEIYDGNAREDGAVDQSAIMNIDPKTASTAGNLINHWHLDIAVDSGTQIIDKELAGHDPELKLSNNTVSGATSYTTPQVKLFEVITPPAITYAGESVTFTQPGSTGSSTVRWYSDSGHSSLVNTGAAYSFTVPSAGAQNLYVTDTLGSAVQPGTLSYTSYATSGFEDYSYDFSYNNYDISYLWSTTTYDASLLTDIGATAGKCSFHVWYAPDAGTYFNGNMPFFYGASSGQYQISIHGNTTYPYISMKLNNTTTTCLFNQHGTHGGNVPTWVKGGWRCLTFSHDANAGTLTAWSYGTNLGTITNSALEFPIIPNGTTGAAKMYFSPYFGKVAQLAFYDDLLTDAEAIAMQGGAGKGGIGDTQDLENLTGSKDKLIDYWKFEEAHDNDSADRLTSTEGGYFILPSGAAANNSARRTTERP